MHNLLTRRKEEKSWIEEMRWSVTRNTLIISHVGWLFSLISPTEFNLQTQLSDFHFSFLLSSILTVLCLGTSCISKPQSMIIIMGWEDCLLYFSSSSCFVSFHNSLTPCLTISLSSILSPFHIQLAVNLSFRLLSWSPFSQEEVVRSGVFSRETVYPVGSPNSGKIEKRGSRFM